MRVVVFGAGAVGSRFGAALARAGHEVTLIARGEQLEALRSRGLEVEGDTRPVLRLPAFGQLPEGPAPDVVLLTVKSYDVAEAGTQLAGRLARPSPVVALSNGLGIAANLEDALRAGGWTKPEEWVLRGVHTVPALLVRPGVMRPTGVGEIRLGTTGPPRPFVEELAAALVAARLRAVVSDDIRRDEWMKGLINAAINPVTADHGISNGRLVLEPWRGQAILLLHEALAVAAAEGYRFPADTAEEAVFGVARLTSENRSSMLADLEHGRRTEIDAISGVIAAAARRHGIPTPATDRAIVRIHARESEAQGTPGAE